MGGHDPVAAERGQVEAVVEALAVHERVTEPAGTERVRDPDLGDRPAVAGQGLRVGAASGSARPGRSPSRPRATIGPVRIARTAGDGSEEGPIDGVAGTATDGVELGVSALGWAVGVAAAGVAAVGVPATVPDGPAPGPSDGRLVASRTAPAGIGVRASRSTDGQTSTAPRAKAVATSARVGWRRTRR